MSDLRLPRATYRIQLSAHCGFEQLAELAPYLAALGVSDCYLSPFLKTRPGSQHGYDIIDHESLNPELGGEAGYERLCGALAAYGLGQVADVVPNHVGIMGSDSVWWLDVLENGQASRYADYFDIDWHPVKRELHDKVLVPILGEQYGRVLVKGDLELRHDRACGEFSVHYFGHRFPLDPATYPVLLKTVARDLATLEEPHSADLVELESINRSLERLPPHTTTDPIQREIRYNELNTAKRRLIALSESSSAVRDGIDRTVASQAGEPGRRETFESLHRLLDMQPYRLAYWRVAADDINYRRFFDINDLAALRTEDPAVLEAAHRRILALVEEGRIQGLRIDHLDGLLDPRGYLRWLRATLRSIGAPQTYLVVEKITASHEHLPNDWPADGTTGYDFSAIVNGLFVHAPSEREFEQIYRAFTRQRETYEDILYRCKRDVLVYHLSSEVTVLSRLLSQLAESRMETRDFTLHALRDALLEMVAAFPVYRSYITDGEISEQDRQHVEWTVAQAKRRYRGRDVGVIEFIRDLLLQHAEGDEAYRKQALKFIAKFQQLTAPVMAKGLEDTFFYRYTMLLSLNEVGGTPSRFGVTTSAFHHLMQSRVQHWPRGMLNTSTHDSKRSEDVRARINVLSEIPQEWHERLTKWRRFNRSKRSRLGDEPVPSRNDEYLFYQTLVGSWPLPMPPGGLEDYRKRLEQYMLKAVREAKLNTSWANPDAAYEERLLAFVSATLSDSHTPFLTDLGDFVAQIAPAGVMNGLAQVLLKLTAPGVPDIYQGTELWDLSLVDPDNRRPVDFERRQRMLAELEALRGDSEGLDQFQRDLSQRLGDDRAKLYLTWQTLSLRRAHAALFDAGAYVPLEIEGPRQEHACAFARAHEQTIMVVAVGRWFATLGMGAAPAQNLQSAWRDTRLRLPAGGTYREALTGRSFDVPEAAPVLALDALLASWPAALLLRAGC